MEKKSRRASKHFVLLRNLMSRYRNKEVSPTDKVQDHQLLVEMFYNPMMDTRKPSTAKACTDNYNKGKERGTVFLCEEGQTFKRSKVRAANQRTSLRRMKAIRDLQRYFSQLESDFPTNVHHQLYIKPSESKTEQIEANHFLNYYDNIRLNVESGESHELHHRISENVPKCVLNDLDEFVEAPSPIAMMKRRRRTRDLRHAVYERQCERKPKLPWQPVHTSTPKHPASSVTKSPCTNNGCKEELLFTFLNSDCLNIVSPRTSTPIRQEPALQIDYSLLAQISTPVLMPYSDSTEKSTGGQGHVKKLKKIRSRLFSDSNNSSVKSYGFV